MAPPVLTPSYDGNGPGRRFPLRLSVPRGMQILRRPDAGVNPYRNEPGPGFWSGENLDRPPPASRTPRFRPQASSHPRGPPPPPCCSPAPGGRAPEFRPRASSHPRRSPPPCYPPPPRMPRTSGPHLGRDIGRPSRVPPPDTHLPRFHRMEPRGRPLTRQEYPGHLPSSRSRHRDFGLHERRSPFRFHLPDDDDYDDDDYYDYDSDDDSTTSFDSDSETYARREPSYPTRLRRNPFRFRERRRPNSDEDSTLTAFRNDRHRGRRFNLDPMDGLRHRGRLPRRADHSPDLWGLRATSSESRRNWFL
ncbi:hypothetical protein FQN54_004090 [Arachnomyces sp. PD_36]|nr:hypothetical protein FQN54_004090 [Arachnomyces sp. PD_36]